MLSTIGALAEARVCDLSVPLSMGIPTYPSHPPYLMTPMWRHGDRVTPCGFSGANEVIILSGHTGTHLDAPAHVSRNGLLHGDQPAAAHQDARGVHSGSVDQLPPILCSGVLLDVARARGVPCLPAGAAIGAGELAAVARQQGVEISPGDAVLIRTGWMQHFSNPETYLNRREGTPGPNAEAAAWLAARGVRVTGSDTLTYEATIPGMDGFAAHLVLLRDHGIPIIEMLNLEELAAAGIYRFLFICVPLRLRGATGSPVRPLAIAGGWGQSDDA